MAATYKGAGVRFARGTGVKRPVEPKLEGPEAEYGRDLSADRCAKLSRLLGFLPYS